MKRPAEKEGNAIRTIVRGLALSVVLLLALAAVMQHVSSVPSAHASAPESAQATAPARAPDPAAMPETQPGSLAIREAHSDGGYQYWLDRQPAERATNTH